MWLKCCPKQIEILTAEPSIDTLAEMYQSFYESTELVGKGCLTLENMQNFIESAKSTLEEFRKRVQERAEERAADLAATQNNSVDIDDDDSLSVQYAIETTKHFSSI